MKKNPKICSAQTGVGPDNQRDLEELLLRLDELFALLHFTPHLFHLILVRLPWYHICISLQLVLHLEGLANKSKSYSSPCPCLEVRARCWPHLGCPTSPRGFSVSSTAAGCCLWAAPERARRTGPGCLCCSPPASPLRLNWPTQSRTNVKIL